MRGVSHCNEVSDGLEDGEKSLFTAVGSVRG